MSIESKIDVLAAAINRLADALNSKCSSSCHQTGAEVKPAAAPVAPAAPAAPLETVLTVTAADVKSALMNVIDEPVKPAKAKKEPVAAQELVMPPPPVFAAPAPVTPTPAKAGAPFTDGKGLIEYVMATYSALGPEKGARIQEVVNALGCKVVNEIKPEQYEAFYQGVEALK